jgi:hypothetical protein
MLAAQERIALFALLIFLERHHVHRAHGLDARFHFIEVRLGGDESFARQQDGLLANQFLGLRVEFSDAGLTEIIAV